MFAKASAVLALFAASVLAPAADPPAIPVGLDAYRMWERWPYQRIGARAYMRSTYDRTGGNERADASHFLYQQADDFNVTLDVAGPGVLYFARYNHWHGSPWHYEVDGKDHIVRRRARPIPCTPSRIRSSCRRPVPQPADLDLVPHQGRRPDVGADPVREVVPHGLLAHHYGTGYYIYHQFVRGAKLSRPIVELGRQNAAGPRRAPADRPRGRATLRRSRARRE